MKRIRTIAPVLMAVALFLLVPRAQAQVLDQVPADAIAVIKFNKLKPLSDKMGAMADKLGLANLQPKLKDPLGSFKEQAKLQNGLDENGDAAVAFMAPPQGQRGEPTVIAFLPVTDYKAFIGNFADAKTEGDVTTAKIGNDPNPSTIVNWGKYAVLSDKADAVKTKPANQGVKASGMAAKELSEKDIVAYFNVKGSRDRIVKAIKDTRTEALRDFERSYKAGMGGQANRRSPGAAPGAADAPAANDQATKFLPVMKALINRVFDVAEQVCTDADAATYGWQINDDGIKSTMMAEFANGSTSAQNVANLKGSDQSLLTGLPQAKYLFVGGFFGDPAGGSKLISNFTGPIEQQLNTVGADAKPIQDYLKSVKDYMAAVKSSASGMLAPSGQLGQEAIFQFVSINTGDANAMVTAQKEMINSQQAFMDMFSPPQMRGMMTMNFTPNAKTVDGVQLNSFSTQFNAPAGQPQSPQFMQMKQMMTWMYGPNGMNGVTGVVGNDKMIGAVGTNDATVGQLIAAAKANQDVLTPTFQAVTAQLPKQRFAAAYIQLDQIVTTVANYAKMFGMPINFQLPPNLQPIGVTFATEGSAIRADGYVPAQTLQSIIAAGIQSYMQMQGGQQPGGPGGL